MATNKRCHEGRCTSCALCKRSNPKYQHLVHMEGTEHEWLEKNEPSLSQTACICLPCIKQIKRNVNNPGFSPRWCTKAPKPVPKCNIDNCQHSIYRNTNLVSVTELQQILGENVTAFMIECYSESSPSAPTPPASIGLCQEHYQKMYAHLHKTDSCDSCGGKARKGESYSRHCPAPHIINNYLNHISGESRTLTSSSKLCYTCYKYFSGIVKELQNETIQPQTTKKGNTDSVISYLLQRIQDIEETGEDITKDDVFELAL